MRTSEWIQIGFAVVLAAASWIQPLPARRRLVTTALAFIAIIAILAARASASFLSPAYVATLRDWLTAALMLVPYWQTGQFFSGPNEKIQARLMELDQRWFPHIASASGTSRGFIALSLEIAYLFCYPLVPCGLAVLYVAGLRQDVSIFWWVVLISTYLCYAITPFVRALPPRSIGKAASVPPSANSGRAVNRWVLQHGSIHAISFPSAHVASALSVALVLLWFTPIAGVVFLVIAIWISVAAVVGRYHYALDVFLGAATALIVFILSYAFMHGRL
ncbi:MAG TPA: phosphatase PAP2 family protein [Edaphobacter sp.]|nr:phosphatase PAP2 family protein [Edaphobacter sp.]